MRKTVSILLAFALLGGLMAGTTVAPAAKKKAKVTVGNNFFKPKKMAVKRGTKVRFRWTGGGLHNVTKRKGPGGKFRSKTTSSAGVHFRKKFKKRGKYRLVCTIHPSAMKMTLRVR
jgi:plastocyanin